jgi:ferredoxin
LEGDRIMSAFILGNICLGCKRCINACPVHAITIVAHLPVVEHTMCMECEACMEVCMHGAITFRASSFGASENGG